MPLVTREPAEAIRNLLRIQHVRMFEGGAEGHGGDVRAGDPADRGVQAGEASPSELSRNLGTEAAGPVGLVATAPPAGFPNSPGPGFDPHGGGVRRSMISTSIPSALSR